MVTVALLANVEPGTPSSEWEWVYTAYADDGERMYSSGKNAGIEHYEEMLEFVKGLVKT